MTILRNKLPIDRNVYKYNCPLYVRARYNKSIRLESKYETFTCKYLARIGYAIVDSTLDEEITDPSIFKIIPIKRMDDDMREIHYTGIIFKNILALVKSYKRNINLRKYIKGEVKSIKNK